MRYTLLLHYPEMTAEELGEDALKDGMAAFDAYSKALEGAGVLLSAEVLAPSPATTTISRKTGEPSSGRCGPGRRWASPTVRRHGCSPSPGTASATWWARLPRARRRRSTQRTAD